MGPGSGKGLPFRRKGVFHSRNFRIGLMERKDHRIRFVDPDKTNGPEFLPGFKIEILKKIEKGG